MDELQLLETANPVREDSLAEANRSPLFEELFADLVSADVASEAPGAAQGGHRRSRGATTRRLVARRPVLAVAAAIAVVAAVTAVVLSVSSGPSGVPGAFITTWQPSRPASHPAVPKAAGNARGAFRLVSYIEGPEWKKGSGQVPPGYLDCPALDACYLLAQTELIPVEPYANYYNSVYFSGDGGASWSSLPLPSHLEVTAPLSCPGALACVGVGYQGDKNELVSTTDGGHRWLVSPLHAPADVMSLSCSSVLACSLVTQSSDSAPGAPQQFASTTNGGASWSLHSFASDLYISSMSCPKADDCVAIASLFDKSTTVASKAHVGLALLTTDGGRTWSRSPLPGTVNGPLAPGGPGDLSLLSCAGTSDCTMFGNSTDIYSLQGSAKLPSHCPPGGCVLHYRRTWQADVASTSDSGRHWQLHALPSTSSRSFALNYMPGQPSVRARYSFTYAAGGPDNSGPDLSCPRAGDCWFSGGPVDLLWTTDGGSHWSSQAVAGNQGLSQVSCPEPDQCVALGASTVTVHNSVPFQSNSVPVYSSITGGSR